jgi:starvation-inducible outer membrane lipoprotein
MRKTIILAAATLLLACATVVTGIARTIEGPSANLASLVVSPHTIGGLTARLLNAI